MLPVPGSLVKQGVPRDANQVRMLDRWLLAYNGPHKFQILCTYFALQMKRAIPAWGDSKSYYNPGVTHEELARSAGVARSTFSSRMCHLRTLDGPDDPRRSPVYIRGPRSGKARDKFIHVAGFIHSNPGYFLAANKYSLAVPDGKTEAMRTRIEPGQYCPPNPDELLRVPGIGPLFRMEARFDDPCPGKRTQIYTTAERGFKGANGAKAVPLWVWHEKADLSDIARVVLTVYIMRGLLDQHNKGLLKGFRQPDVAAATGLSVTSVYLANKELKAKDIVRSFSPLVPCRAGSKAVRRTPQQILYLPIRRFTDEERDHELERWRLAMQRLRTGSWGEPDVNRLNALHGALLREWTGHEHGIKAFWNELRKRANHWAIPKELQNYLIPLDFT